MASKPQKQAAAPKKAETFTVRELKAWIEALEELQGSDWVPNAEQWKKLKGKISLLPIEDVVIERLQYPPGVRSTKASEQPARPAPAPVVEEPTRVMPTAAFASVTPSAPAPAVRTTIGADGKPRTVTPSIDTSKEPYKSPYT